MSILDILNTNSYDIQSIAGNRSKAVFIDYSGSTTMSKYSYTNAYSGTGSMSAGGTQSRYNYLPNGVSQSQSNANVDLDADFICTNPTFVLVDKPCLVSLSNQSGLSTNVLTPYFYKYDYRMYNSFKTNDIYAAGLFITSVNETGAFISRKLSYIFYGDYFSAKECRLPRLWQNQQECFYFDPVIDKVNHIYRLLVLDGADLTWTSYSTGNNTWTTFNNTMYDLHLTTLDETPLNYLMIRPRWTYNTVNYPEQHRTIDNKYYYYQFSVGYGGDKLQSQASNANGTVRNIINNYNSDFDASSEGVFKVMSLCNEKSNTNDEIYDFILTNFES